MEVELDDTILAAQPCEELAVLAICALGWVRRHRVLPQSQGVWDAWAKTLPPDLEDQVKNVWSESRRRSATGPASERVRVVPTVSNQFDQQPLILAPGEALNLLGRPLRVFLENGRYDRAFLLAFADTATRKAFMEAEQAGWLVVETAGGIAELVARALDAATHPAPREVFRTMYMCDSDAREENAPSSEAAEITNSLASLATTYNRVPAHFGTVLRRRAAENYAPPDVVLHWAQVAFGVGAAQVVAQAQDPAQQPALITNPGVPNSTRRRLLAAVALTNLPSRVRGHLDMKWGRLRQGNPPNADVIRTIDAVWNQLSAFQQEALRHGFGASFSASFYDKHVGLTDETREVTDFLTKVLERV